MREKLLDPTGTSDRAVDTTLAPRLRSLRGLTAGLLENGKPNAAVLLTETGRELQDRYGIRDFTLFRKSYFGHPVEESLYPADPAQLRLRGGRDRRLRLVQRGQSGRRDPAGAGRGARGQHLH